MLLLLLWWEVAWRRSLLLWWVVAWLVWGRVLLGVRLASILRLLLVVLANTVRVVLLGVGRWLLLTVNHRRLIGHGD